MPRPPKGVIPPHLRGYQFKKGHVAVRRQRRGNPGGHRRAMTPGEARAMFDRMYAADQAKAEAFLRSPEGDAKRIAENEARIAAHRQKYPRKNPSNKTDPYYGQGKPDRAKMLDAKRRADARHIERTHSRKKNAATRGVAAIYIHKMGRPKAETMHYTGHSFSNNDPPKVLPVKDAAIMMDRLRQHYPGQLRGYLMWIEAPRPVKR